MNLDTPAALTDNIFKSFSESKLKIVSLDVRYTVRKSSKLSLPTGQGVAFFAFLHTSNIMLI